MLRPSGTVIVRRRISTRNVHVWKHQLQGNPNMAHESIVYGIIDTGERNRDGERERRMAINRLAIEQLSSSKSVLVPRGMFAISDDSATFRTQLIHFAASHNYLEDQWHRWLEEFEQLLRHTCWIGVDVRVIFDQISQSFSYSWSASSSAIAECLYADPPRLINDWVFEGGPRDLRQS